MGQKFTRKKPRNILTSIIYRLGVLPFASKRSKFKLYSDLSWIFNRLSLENSFACMDPEEHPTRLMTLKYIISEVNADSTILDIGCSQGDISYKLSEICKEVVGIDYNFKSIINAKNKYIKNNLNFLCMDASEYLLKSEKKFEVMICSHIIEHLEDPKNFLRSYKNYFKKIYIEIPDFDNTYVNILRNKIGIQPHYSDTDHVFEFSRDELENIFKELNLKVIKCEFRYGVMQYWVEC